MREIKCRAYHKIEKRMYYFDWQTVTQVRFPGYYNPVDKSKDCELSDTSLYEETQWFTGLKDKNGQEIYEGDIIRGVYSSHPQTWTVGELSAYGLTFNRLTIKPFPASYHYRDMRHTDQWEVIGNIHENSELLEVKI